MNITNSEKLEVAAQLLAGLLANPEIARALTHSVEEYQKPLVVSSVRMAEMLLCECYPGRYCSVPPNE